MSSTSLPPLAARMRGRLGPRRISAWLVARATAPATSLWVVVTFAVVHAVLWTAILTNLKAAQDVHMDVAEAYAWGSRFLLGYGKHPPLSGWIAGLWFAVFPVKDWATYALAMAVNGSGLVIVWLASLKVVDRRRAFFVVVMVALYPIFNFKGFKYNADLVQLLTLPLLVLAYLNAFEKRSAASGLWLGLAGAAALMTKYWVLTMIGAIGLAALLHPERLRFLASPAPWVAIVTMLVAMIPHLVWLWRVDFVAITYAGDVYTLSDRGRAAELVLGYVGHNLALLALPVALAALVMAWPPRFAFRNWRGGPNPGVNVSQAINVWLVQAIVAVGPPLGGLAFTIYMKTDWGISLFFLVPLALVAIPALRLRSVMLPRLAAVWLVLSLLTLIASPWIARREMAANPNGATGYGARSELARELTKAWHARFGSPWPLVAGFAEMNTPMTFYSPDHPRPFTVPTTPEETWSSGLSALEDLKREGFIGICDTTDNRIAACEAWMAKEAPTAEPLVMTTQRFFHGQAGPAIVWKVYIQASGG
ncbi:MULTISPECIES: glycosyltransferase family 39 protein [unclassified Bradyrhizobium]|uniref:glycosyltransferase family 39 protein n=1 Tax=unclassified Bradyrhizobium TaxID=2631580 RepID=UPI0028EAB811|nr:MULTISPECIES: glycosyltransferase family 39 protein [unclassified Bradyrhizobium]